MSVDSASLALIYSRLADLESQKLGGKNILDSIAEKFALHQVSEEEQAAIEAKFQQTISSHNTIEDVRVLFEEEHKIKDELTKSLTVKANLYNNRKLGMDKLIADSIRLRESITALQPQLLEVGELCRSLQTLEKEKSEHHAKMLACEKEKTASIDKECGNSLSSVSGKIDAEEADIDLKAKENDELRDKLDQFRSHLELRKEKLRNDEKTRELKGKLEAAKLAQRAYVEEQERMKRDSCRSKIIHSEETILNLQNQLKMYDEKFQEFDSTIRRTAEIMGQLDERETMLLSVVTKLRADGADWKTRASQAEVALINVLDEKKKAEEDLASLRASVSKSEKKCRLMQTHRKEQQQRSAAAGNMQLQSPLPPAPTAVPSSRVRNENAEGLVGEGSPMSSK